MIHRYRYEKKSEREEAEDAFPTDRLQRRNVVLSDETLLVHHLEAGEQHADEYQCITGDFLRIRMASFGMRGEENVRHTHHCQTGHDCRDTQPMNPR